MDGGFSWLVLGCSFCSVFCINFLIVPAAIIQVEIMEDLHFSSGVVSTMTALALGLGTVLGPLSGVLCNVLSLRYTVFLGTCLMSSGMLVTSFCTTPLAMVIFYGIVTGTGCGLTLGPSIVVISLYFDRRRVLATGIAFCASGLALLSIPYLVRYVIDAYGWRYAMALNAAIVLHVFVFASFFRPTEVERRRMLKLKLKTSSRRPRGFRHHDHDVSSTIGNDVTGGSDVTVGNVRKATAGSGCLEMDELRPLYESEHIDSDIIGKANRQPRPEMTLCQPRPEMTQCQPRPEMTHVRSGSLRMALSSDMGSLTSEPVTDLSHQSPEVKDFSLMATLRRVLRSKEVWIVSVHCFFYMSGYGIYSVHFPAYVVSKGLPIGYVSSFYTVSGLTLLLGRLLGAVLFQILKPPLLLLVIGLEILMALDFGLCPLFALTTTGIFIMEAFQGLLYGQSYMLQAPLVAQLVTVEDLPVAYGVLQLFNGLGYVTAPIFAGFIYDVTNTYDIPMHMAGCCVLIGSLCLLAVLCLKPDMMSRRRMTDNRPRN